MNIKDILKKVDHTILSPTAKWEDIVEIMDDAIKFETASVCIAPCYVKKAKDYLNNEVKICTVIGFPLGYQTTEVKEFETRNAIENGADEIDMVINISSVKNNYDNILEEIKIIKKACNDKILKVIIETAYLDKEEKIKLCEIVSESGADFIKTSTGFAKSGACIEDIKLFKKYLKNDVKIKAAGGISSIEDAEEFIKAGADRLGTSRIVKLVKGQKDEGSY